MTNNRLFISGILGARIVTFAIATTAGTQDQETGFPLLVSFVLLAFVIQWRDLAPA